MRIRVPLAAVVLLAGCAPAWRPTVEPAPVPQPPQTVDLARYRSAPADVPRVYTRVDMKHPEDEPAVYTQMAEGPRQFEGTLVACEPESLYRYLRPFAPEAPWAQFPWPPVGRMGSVFYLELHPPLPRIPAAVGTRQPTVRRAEVRQYDYAGRARLRGDLCQTVSFDGFETIETRDSRLTDCVRLRIVTRVALLLGPHVDLIEHVWLGEGVGEVRRVEQLRGWAWFFPFDEVRRYDLTNLEAVRAHAASQPAGEPMLWALVAVHLDQSVPHPRVAGLAAERAVPPP